MSQKFSPPQLAKSVSVVRGPLHGDEREDRSGLHMPVGRLRATTMGIPDRDQGEDGAAKFNVPVGEP